MRPAGTIPTKPFNTASIFATSPPTAWLTALCNISVSKPPATNAFTRIPSAAYSCAADLVRPKIPALDIEYRAAPLAPPSPFTEEVYDHASSRFLAHLLLQ